jgi:hypothetical protein
MAETSTGHVVLSDLPDLTEVALADLPALSLRHEDAVLDRATAHPEQRHTDQRNMPV